MPVPLLLSFKFSPKRDSAVKLVVAVIQPTKLGKFELLETVGRGAFGTVYRGE
jgi:hypothetical protein